MLHMKALSNWNLEFVWHNINQNILIDNEEDIYLDGTTDFAWLWSSFD